jgi:hypothetical protein
MKKLEIILIVLLFQFSKTWGQNMYLNPASIGPSSYVITVSSAGVNPNNPTTNNISQSVCYRWQFAGEEASFMGNITVQSSSIPSGITVTVKATGDDGSDGWFLTNRYGTGNVTITVGSTAQYLISGIWSTNAGIYWGTLKTISRPLNQNITISNFSNLHPGTYPVTLTYIMQ